MSVGVDVEAAPTRRRGRRWALVLGGTAAALVAGWFAAGTWTAQHVELTWAPTCEDQPDAAGTAAAPVEARREFRCDLRLAIENRSFRSVHVSAVDAAFMGPSGGAEVRGLSSEAAELGPQPDSDVDGRWELDLTVPAHSVRQVVLPIGWREEGCDPGGELTLYDWPTVVLDAWGRSLEVPSRQDLNVRTFDDPHDDVACPNP